MQQDRRRVPAGPAVGVIREKHHGEFEALGLVYAHQLHRSACNTRGRLLTLFRQFSQPAHKAEQAAITVLLEFPCIFVKLHV